MPHRLADLAALDRDAFVAVLGAVFEDSPWVAAAAWGSRPFADVAQLHAAMRDVVRAAGAERQRALILAHPDLADKATRPATLAAFSQTEQARAGLNDLTEAEIEEQRALNRAYRARFGFPFIMAVRFSTPQKILEGMRARVQNAPEVEFAQALEEIYKIAEFRLADLIVT